MYLPYMKFFMNERWGKSTLNAFKLNEFLSIINIVCIAEEKKYYNVFPFDLYSRIQYPFSLWFSFPFYFVSFNMWVRCSYFSVKKNWCECNSNITHLIFQYYWDIISDINNLCNTHNSVYNEFRYLTFVICE